MAQGFEEFQHFRLYGNVKSGCGFVGDEHRWLCRDRHGDGYPLAHASAETVWI